MVSYTTFKVSESQLMTYLIADLFIDFSQLHLLFEKLNVVYISNTSHLNKTTLKPHKMIDSTVS